MGTYHPVDEPTFVPTADQLARDKKLRRFNRLYIYLPIGIGSLLIFGIIILILVGIFSPGIIGTEEFISAMADIILILWIFPLIILGLIGPISYLAYIINRRKKRKLNPQTGPLAYRSRIQILLWRLLSFLDNVGKKTDETAPMVADPIIRFNSFITYLESWLNILKEQLLGSKDYDPDGHNEH